MGTATLQYLPSRIHNYWTGKEAGRVRLHIYSTVRGLPTLLLGLLVDAPRQDHRICDKAQRKIDDSNRRRVERQDHCNVAANATVNVNRLIDAAFESTSLVGIVLGVNGGAS